MHDKDIWANAPEDATHYLPEYDHLHWSGDYWYKKIGNDWLGIPCERPTEEDYGWTFDYEDVEIFEPLLILRPIPFSPEDAVEVRCNGWSDWQIGTLKYKSEKFSEKKEKQKVKVSEELNLSEASQSVLHNLTSYVTESRVVSVISKIGKVGTKDFQRILGLTVQDAIEDYEKDTDVNVKDVCGEEWKSVLKMLNGLSAHIVRSEFVKHID